MNMLPNHWPYTPRFAMAHSPDELGGQTFALPASLARSAGTRVGDMLDTTPANLVPRACAAALAVLQGTFEGAVQKPQPVPITAEQLHALGYRMTQLLISTDPGGRSEDHAIAGQQALVSGVARALDEMLALNSEDETDAEGATP